MAISKRDVIIVVLSLVILVQNLWGTIVWLIKEEAKFSWPGSVILLLLATVGAAFWYIQGEGSTAELKRSDEKKKQAIATIVLIILFTIVFWPMVVKLWSIDTGTVAVESIAVEEAEKAEEIPAPPKVDGVELSMRQAQLIGPETEAAEMLFLRLWGIELKKKATFAALKEYRSVQKWYSENSTKMGHGKDLEEERKKLLEKIGYKEVDGGKVELLDPTDAHKAELEKRRTFLKGS